MTKTTRIGHSSISEHGTIHGSPGENNGKQEVYINNSYSIPGLNANVLLRPVSAQVAELSARACEAGCNNSNIGYSQHERGTLRKQALKLNSNLTKVDLALIGKDSAGKTKACNCDCSSFMSLCAEIGGAQIDQSGGIPRTGTMEKSFTKFGHYRAFKDSKYFEQADYLRRGDILVRAPGHTIMVLTSGANAGSGDYYFSFGTNTNIPEQVKFIELTVTKASHTEVTAEGSVIVKKSESGEVISNGTVVSKHTWSYSLVPISNKKLSTKTGSVSVNKEKFSFSISGLNPSTSYSLEVIAKMNKKIDFSSHNIVFTTLPAAPSPIRDLEVTLPATDTLEPSFNVAFKEPSSWNKPAGGTSGYRICLLVNGKVIAFNDKIITCNNSTVDTVVTLKDLIGKKDQKVFSYGDIIQLGVQAWNKDDKKNVFFDSDSPKCSKAFYIIPAITPINTTHLKIVDSDKFERAIVHDNTEGA